MLSVASRLLYTLVFPRAAHPWPCSLLVSREASEGFLSRHGTSSRKPPLTSHPIPPGLGTSYAPIPLIS